MKAANLDKDCLPLPPTPTSKALPRGDSKIRFILKKYIKKVLLMLIIKLVMNSR